MPLNIVWTIVFASANITVSISSMIMNIIFVFCMVFPQKGTERLKNPLNVLLGSLVGSNIALNIFSCVVVLIDLMLSSSSLIYDIISMISLFTMRISFTSTVWLNVFYYFQIVPAQCSVFIWLKKNIRVFIYSCLLMDRIFFLNGFIIAVVNIIHISGVSPPVGDTGIPMKPNITDSNITLLVNTSLELGYFSICLCVMLASSYATVLYLWRHLKDMKESSRSFSSPRLQKQVRVTITGIIQAALYFLCSSTLVADEFLFVFMPSFFSWQERFMCTVSLLYTFATTINLGFGQSIFRQGVISVSEKLLQNLNLYT